MCTTAGVLPYLYGTAEQLRKSKLKGRFQIYQVTNIYLNVKLVLNELLYFVEKEKIPEIKYPDYIIQNKTWQTTYRIQDDKGQSFILFFD